MIPAIDSVLGIEMLRGGDLYCASFTTEGQEFVLAFAGNFVDDTDGYSSGQGFKPPVIAENVSHRKHTLSWEHAMTYLRQMHPLLQNKDEEKHLLTMFEIAYNEGNEPPARDA